MKMDRPKWVDQEEYPFQDCYYQTPMGRIHYIDEGQGEPIVFFHGNPTWSFLYRKVIKILSNRYRCIALDLMGFGLSDKPEGWTYRPQDHAVYVDQFLNSLGLSSITLVVNDWGGPIGLSYALKNPLSIKALVITNTWMWPVNKSLYYSGFSAFMGGWVGRKLIQSRNFFARDMVKMVFGNKKKLTTEIHNHYLLPLDRPAERKGSWIFPKEIIQSTSWLADLWSQREKLAGKKILIVWGEKDIAFGKKELKTWKDQYPGARVVNFPDCGHFVAEEKPQELASEIQTLLS